MSSMTTPLYDTGYWSIKGLGAPLRMLLCWANVPFTATMYDVKMLEGRGLDAKGWFGPKKALKEKNPFVNLPYVAAGDDVLVSQSNACFSFLGRELNMMGQSPNELIMCETLLCEMMDLRNSMTRFAYSDEFANVEADGVALLSNVMGKNGVLQKIELHLANEKLSAPSRSDRFLVGGNCTAPDFHLYEMLDQYLLLSEFVKKGDLLLEFPNLREFYQFFKGHSKNAYYLASNLNKLPFNNKSARFGSVIGSGRFEEGQEYDWANYTGVYKA